MNRQQSFQNNLPSLYVLATPIGNLKEISPRIIDALQQCEVVFCEDTRVSGQLLAYLKIKKPLISAYENIEQQSAEKVIHYLSNQQSVALMSDAGYPGISDPGQAIISKVIANQFNVVVINGPSALIQAVLASGFSTQHFYFYGFLNAKSSARKKELEELKEFANTLIFYQSPHKVKACLEDMLQVFGNRNICLCREMTKLYEEYIRGTIEEILPICETLKGEMVLVVQGYEKVETRQVVQPAMIEQINQLINYGKKTNEAIKEVAKQSNVSRNELYDYYHNGGN